MTGFAVVGELGKDVEITLRNNGAAYNPTGLTIQHLIRKPDGSTITRSASVVGTTGLTRWTTNTVTSDFDLAGRWVGITSVSNGSTQLFYTLPWTIVVHPRLV